MKKLLVFLVMLGLFGVFAVSGVLALDAPPINTTQTASLVVGEDVFLTVSPSMVDFGRVIPSQGPKIAVNGPVIFNTTGSNVDLLVIPHFSEGLFGGIEYRYLPSIDPESSSLPWRSISDVTFRFSLGEKIFRVPIRITVPIGTLPRTVNDTIIYTVTQDPHL